MISFSLCFDQNHGRDRRQRDSTFHRFDGIGTCTVAVDADMPCSFGQGNGFGRFGGAEDQEQFPGRFTGNTSVNMESAHMGMFAVDRNNVGENFICRSKPQYRVGLPEADQSPVIADHILILGEIQQIPFDGVDAVGGLEAVH